MITQEYIEYLVNNIALKHDYYLRVNWPVEITFPHYYHVVNHPKVEVRHNLPMAGWGKPDLIIGNCELHYLWKDIRIMTFEQFQTTVNNRQTTGPQCP